jgi:hypothetical protein
MTWLFTINLCFGDTGCFVNCVFNLIAHNLCKQWITNVRWLFSVICLMITRSQGFCTTLQGQHGDGVTAVSSSNFCGCVPLDIQSHKQYIYICIYIYMYIYIYGWYINIYGCFNQQYMVYIPSFHGSFEWEFLHTWHFTPVRGGTKSLLGLLESPRIPRCTTKFLTWSPVLMNIPWICAVYPHYIHMIISFLLADCINIPWIVSILVISLTNIPWIFAFISHSRLHHFIPLVSFFETQVLHGLGALLVSMLPVGATWKTWNHQWGPFGAHFDGFKRVDSMGNLPSGKLTCWPWKTPIFSGN